MTDHHDHQQRHVRTTIPLAWATALAHLAADLGLHRHQLLREGLLLLLRYHGVEAGGLPEPVAPLAPKGGDQ